MNMAMDMHVDVHEIHAQVHVCRYTLYNRPPPRWRAASQALHVWLDRVESLGLVPKLKIVISTPARRLDLTPLASDRRPASRALPPLAGFYQVVAVISKVFVVDFNEVYARWLSWMKIFDLDAVRNVVFLPQDCMPVSYTHLTLPTICSV